MDIDALVETHFKKNRDIFGFEAIAELIEEVMDSMEATDFLLSEEREERAASPAEQRRSRTLRFPLIIPAEQSVGQYTAAEGSEDRATFEAWMKKIAPEGDLKAKTAAIQQFIDNPPEGMTVATTLSYLMFLQTFSYMIREFNASVAGFLWEPFLAAMFGGQSVQVHTEEGDIADVKLLMQTGGGLQRVSLKILSPTGAVGGSFVDLVNHFAKNPEQPMVYVVIRKMPGKTNAGQAIKEATMAFWQFEISQETFFKWIGPPGLAILKETLPYTHPEDGPEDWGRNELAQYLEAEGKIEKGWRIERSEDPRRGPGKLASANPKGIVPGQTYEIKIRTVGRAPAAAGGTALSGNARTIWGTEEEYAEWYALWQEMQGDPKFWQLVRGPKLLRIKDADDAGPPAIEGPPFAPKGARGYWSKEQFEIGSSYQEAVLGKPIGTINILPSVMQETFARGAEMIGDDLTEMFNALSALIDNVGRFFLIDCGDPQAEVKTCDEKDAAVRSKAGHASIKDAATLKKVVDDRIAAEFARQEADPEAGGGGGGDPRMKGVSTSMGGPAASQPIREKKN